MCQLPRSAPTRVRLLGPVASNRNHHDSGQGKTTKEATLSADGKQASQTTRPGNSAGIRLNDLYSEKLELPDRRIPDFDCGKIVKGGLGASVTCWLPLSWLIVKETRPGVPS